MRIYITRHGETEWNKAGRMQGWKNSNLTEKGVENAKKLGERLKDIEFDHIYCSPLGRAVDTSKYIRGDWSTAITIMDSLKEMGFGSLEGKARTEIEKLYPAQVHNLWNKPHLYEPIDGESYQDLISRVGAVLNKISGDTAAKNILIVTHAAVIKAIYSIFKGIPIEDFWGPPYIYDTCLTVLEIVNGKTNFILEADISHLGYICCEKELSL